MAMDLEKSFTFITEDSEWKKKLAIGGGLGLLSVLILLFPILLTTLFTPLVTIKFWLLLSLTTICIVISAVINLAIFGYFSITAHNRIHNKEKFLPEWSDFGALIAAGVKTVVGHVLCFLPFILCGAIVFLLAVFPALLFPALLFENNLLSGIFSIISLALSLVGFFVLYALIIIFYFLLFGVFLKDLNVLSFLNFKAAYGLVKNNILNYVIFWLFVIIISLIVELVSIILILTIVGILLLPLVFFYSYLVSAEIFAQFVRTQKDPE